MRLDLTKIEAEIAAGNVNKQVHPTLPLAIYKYSHMCVFSRHWNEITLLCRGIVLDDTGEVVINSFPKFFNHSEADGIEDYIIHKSTPYTVSVKMDGSLIQVAKWKGELIITSSGSFTSPQAIKAQELIRPYIDFIEDGKTYIFEIIYEGNRIVLSYPGVNTLTLLAIRDTETGYEYPLDNRFNCVEFVNKTLDEIEQELSQKEFINAEGYVIRFDDGFRVKMKYDAYMKLHKLVSGISEKYIWECLRDGVDIEAQLVDIPDELFDFIKKAKTKFHAEFETIDKAVKLVFQTINKEATRKEQAEHILRHHKEYAKILFSMLDGRDYSKIIWNMIEPDFKPGLMGMGQSAES